MIRSIRWRLALAYVAVWAAILGASVAGVYTWDDHQLRGQLDRGLAFCLQVIGQSLTHEVQEHGNQLEGEKQFSALLVTLHHQSFPRQAISVFQGLRLVARKNGDSGLSVNAPPSVGSLGGIQYESRAVAQIPARIAVRIVQEGGNRYTIVVAETEATIDLALSSLRSALLLLVLLALLLSVGGGYILARYALRPVVEMAEAVDRIHARNLSKRIEVLDSNDELGHLGKVFNGLLSRLNSAFEQERQFMADASHELRTPLSVSLLAAQIALDRPRSEEEYRSSLTTIRAQLERLTRLVQNMLTLARSDATGLAIDRRICRLDELVLDAVHAGSVLARARDIRLEISDLPEAKVSADPDLIRQMIVILLDNAIKYSQANTTVRVSLSETGAFYVLEVTDQGCGIPAEALGRIFDRFFRVDESRSRTTGEGAGLGLPIARAIAQSHDGSIELVNSGPQGSTFRVNLPAAPKALPVSNVVRKYSIRR